MNRADGQHNQIGDPVYAIANGRVIRRSPNGWGNGNVGLLILHTLNNGSQFIAVYGHVQSDLDENDWVSGGTQIATIGPWPDGVHLHFSVVPGTSIPSPLGLADNDQWPNTFGQVDPIGFISSNTPKCIDATSEYHLPTGQQQHPDGSIIKKRTPETAYVLVDGLRRAIPSAARLHELYGPGRGFDFRDIITISDGEFDTYLSGVDVNSPLPLRSTSFEPPGRLIRQRGGVEISIVSTNQVRRPFQTGEAFLKMGYQLCNVATVDNYEDYDEGPAVEESDLGGAPDEFGPNLLVTSHSNGQMVSSSTVTISGTASDAGRGESGIASVTVNGIRANGDTASVSDTANWSRTISLSPGANTITVVATDNAPIPNQTSQTITLNLSGGSGGSGVIATGLSNPTDIATDGTDVFWADWGTSSVKKVSVNGGSVTTLFSGVSNIAALAIDSNYVYFGHGSEVKRVPKGGGSATTLTSSSGAGRLVVDGSNIYWTSYGEGAIKKMSINGGMVTTIASGSNSPSGITLADNKVYWTEQTNPGAIKYVGIGGGSVGTLASNSNTPGVSTDGTNIYWTENVFVNAGRVSKVSIYGGTPTALATGLDRPYDVVVDSSNAYWVEGDLNGAVKQVSLNGGAIITLASNLQSPVAIAADNDNVYWIERNNGGNGTGTLKKATKGSGTSSTSVSVSQTSLNFGNVGLDQANDFTLTITNLASSAGTLTGIVPAIAAPFSVVSGGGPFVLTPGQSKQVTARFLPTTVGSYSGTLSITHNATNQSSPINISMSGVGYETNTTAVWQATGTILLSGNEFARHIAISGGRAYITRSGARMTVVNLNTGTEVGQVMFSAYPSSSPGYVAINGNRAYVALSNLGSNGQLAVVDINTLSVLSYIPVGVDPWAVAVYNNRVYVTNNIWWTNGDPATVRVVDLNTNSVVATIPVGINPNGIAIEPLSGKAYVTNTNSLSKSVTVIDTSTNLVTKTTLMPNEPRAVAILGGRAYVANSANNPGASIEVLSTSTDSIVASIGVGRDCAGVATDAGYVFVANQSSNNVTVIDASMNTAIATLSVGSNPTGIAVNSDTHFVYVVNQLDHTLTILKKVNQPPPTPTPDVTTTAARSVTNTSGRLGGYINPNGTNTTAWFEFGTTSNLSTSNSTSAQSLGSGTSGVIVEADLTGLSPGTVYYFRAVASNNAGTSKGSILSFPTHSTSSCSETVWVDDAIPVGATAFPSNDGWNWVSTNPTPYSGGLANQSANLPGVHDHYFLNVSAGLPLNTGEVFFAYVYLDPSNLPQEIMLSFNNGNWGYRAYWGANLMPYGTDGTASRRYMGPLPAAGQWVRLEVPASQVGLEGHTLTGLSFLQYGGRATWDKVGKCASAPPPPPPCTETVWLDDSVPGGASAVPSSDGWNWVSSNPAPYSGALANQSANLAGVHDHYFVNAAAGLPLGTGDVIFAYVYLDPANLPQEIMLSFNDGNWGYRAYWGANLMPYGIDGTASRRYMGSLPAAGQWVRLEVPASQVGLEGHTLTGLSFLQYGGRASWDRVGKCSVFTTDTVWGEDAVPGGAVAVPSNDGWNWVSSSPAPYSGSLAHRSSLITGVHDHYFVNATETLPINVGDKLIAYVYLDPANPPQEIMLSWNDGNWSYRAYWGANLMPYGIDGTNSRRYMGTLPPAGQWVRLEVPASQVGLEGHTLNGLSFLTYDGRATWDHAGKSRDVIGRP